MPRAFESALLGSIFSGLAMVHEMKNAVEAWMVGFAELGKNFLVIGKVSSNYSGCFLLDDEAHPQSSHLQTLTPVILRFYLAFRVCLDMIPF